MNFTPAFSQLKLFNSENLSKFIWPFSTIQYLGLLARHLIKREKTSDKCCHTISSAVHSSCVYKDIWKPSVGNKLACEKEFDNCLTNLPSK